MRGIGAGESLVVEHAIMAVTGGVYKLTRAKEQAEDWVWIVDHVVERAERSAY